MSAPTNERRTFGRSRFVLAAIAGAAAVAGCTYYNRDMPATHAEHGLADVRVTGPAQSCIPLPVSESRVRDGHTIDFHSGGKRGWRNTLPSDCSGLASEKAFSYETSLSQLCNTDMIHVLSTAGGLHREGSCGLGQFTPVEFAR